MPDESPAASPADHPAESSRLPIYASIVANVAIAATKFTAAAFTGSAAMVAEGLHSLVDTADGTLLLLGQTRSRRPPDDAHPFGYGQELYFWTLIVAVLFFALGGGMSVYEGVQHLITPEPLGDPKWNYVVLGFALLFDGASFVIAVREFRKTMNGRSFWQAMRDSKDPTTFTVVLEDSADIVGITIAFLGVWLGHKLNNPYLDGVASIAIGAVLAVVAVVLVAQSKRLLIGEGADPAIIACIRETAAMDHDVRAVRRPQTVHLGPHELLVTLAVEFDPELPAARVAAAIERLDARVRMAAPDVKHFYVEARSLHGHRDGADA